MPVTVSTPWGERRSRKDMEGFAKLHGLDFSEADAFGLSALPFPVLRGGDQNGCKNVVYGTWKDINVWAFVAWRMSRDLENSDSYEYFTCAAAPIPADCPIVDVHSTNALSRALKGVGLGTQPVTFESEAFNRAFTVQASEPKFAFDVVDAQMMQWLLESGQGWHFSISGRHALVYRNRKRHDAEQTGELLDTMVGFYRRIPDVVVSLYPMNQPKMTPQLALDEAKARAAGFTPHAPGDAPDAAGRIRGRMVITAIQETGVQMSGGRVVQMEMDVTPDGGAPYHLAVGALVLAEHADRVTPGASLGVTIDPANPAMVAIDWDAD